MCKPDQFVEQPALSGDVAIKHDQELVRAVAGAPDIGQTAKAVRQGFNDHVSLSIAIDLVDEAETVDVDEGDGTNSPSPVQLLGGVSVGQVGQGVMIVTVVKVPLAPPRLEKHQHEEEGQTGEASNDVGQGL